jgi:hypothetical protein
MIMGSVVFIQKVQLHRIASFDPWFFLLGDEIPQISDDSSSEVNLSSSDFWVLVAALKVSSLSPPSVLNPCYFSFYTYWAYTICYFTCPATLWCALLAGLMPQFLYCLSVSYKQEFHVNYAQVHNNMVILLFRHFVFSVATYMQPYATYYANKLYLLTPNNFRVNRFIFSCTVI